MPSPLAWPLLALLLALSGCAPIPSRTIEAPRVDASIQGGTNRHADYNIYMLNGLGDACALAKAKKEPSATTDGEGRFVIPAKQGWSLVRWAIPADGIGILSLCIETHDKQLKWAYHSYIRTPEWAPELRLVCYLDKQLDAPLNDGVKELEVESTCHWAES